MKETRIDFFTEFKTEYKNLCKKENGIYNSDLDVIDIKKSN